MLDIQIIANCVPAILIVFGFLLSFANNPSWWIWVVAGIVLQVLWLFTRRRGGAI
jgi:ABC-type multidrug transport system permease subunit